MKNPGWDLVEVKRLHGCKNPEECCTTTNIADIIECGWGNLDDMGFWEFFCGPCTTALTRELLEDPPLRANDEHEELHKQGPVDSRICQGVGCPFGDQG